MTVDRFASEQKPNDTPEKVQSMSLLRARLDGDIRKNKDRHHAMIIIGAVWNELPLDIRARVFDIDGEDSQKAWNDLSENDRTAICCDVFLELFPDDDTSFLLSNHNKSDKKTPADLRPMARVPSATMAIRQGSTRRSAADVIYHPKNTPSMQKFVEQLQGFDPYGRRDEAVRKIGEVWEALDSKERQLAFVDVQALDPEYASCHLSSWSELYGTSFRADVVLKIFNIVYGTVGDKSAHGFPLSYRSAAKMHKYKTAPQYMLALYEFEPVGRRDEAREIVGKTWDQMSPEERSIGIQSGDPILKKCSLNWDQLNHDERYDVCIKVFNKIFGDYRSPFEDTRAEAIRIQQRQAEKLEKQKKMATIVQPETLASFRQNGPEFVLDDRQSIYEPETCARIRELLDGKRVIWLDQDGVVLPSDRDRSLPHLPHKQVIETIQQLAAQGYCLAYWTHSPNNYGFVAETLVKAEIAKLFTLVVCNENYVATEPADIQNCIDAINETPWLDDESKKEMRERVKQGEKYDPFGGGQSFPKMPQIFTENSLTIDDNPHWEDVLSDDNRAAYPVLKPKTLLVKSDISTSGTYFDTEWVKRINEKYPI